VIIDIKPRCYPNTVNCRDRNGVIPVAVLSTPQFDATTIDANTVRFGPSGAQETHRDRSGNARRHVEDVNGDGLDDLVFHFRYGETGLTCVDEWAVLTGRTYGGVGILGRDSIRNTRNWQSLWEERGGRLRSEPPSVVSRRRRVAFPACRAARSNRAGFTEPG
jgi:hypothetical protein